MKRLHRFLCLIFAILLLSHNICFGQITESFAFPADEMTLTTDTINGVEYCNVSYYDTYNNGDPAEPSLPVKYYTFSIPWNATNISVSADILDYNLIQSPATVFPTQEDQPTDGSNSIDFTLPNSSIYNTNAYFPSNITKIAGEGYYQGDNHIVTVAIYPIQYNPILSTLKVNNEIYLNISYTLTSKDNLPMDIISRNKSELRTDGINSTKSIVVNPSSVESFAAPFSPNISPFTVEPLPMYQYCIITSRELAPAFERLVAIKKLKGYDAGVVCMEDIIACENYTPENLTDEIQDNAGSLRAFLKDAYKNGTQYVLLGGKEPHVPIRYGYCTIEEFKNSMTHYIPSDLYFRELNSNWDKNNNFIYGEEGDVLDYSLELYVGRLLCTSISDINNYIEKLIKHDLNPGNGDFSYLKRSLYTYCNTMYHNKNTIESIITDVFPEYYNIYQNNSFPTGAFVVSQINQFKPYFMSFHNHGNPEGVQLTDITPYNNIAYGLNAIDSEEAHHVKENGNGLDNITNRDWPGIMYSMSCTTMPFDDYAFSDKIANLSINFGESYTLGINYGGVAYIGNTRAGYISASTNLEKYFLEELKSGNTLISSAMNSSLKKLIKGYYFHHLYLTHNLLGDPSIDIWTDIPVKYTDANIDVYRGDQNIIVSGSCLDGAKIVVHDTNGNVYTKIGSKNNSTYFTSSPNSHIMIYRHNMIPYFAPLLIQNETINSSQYYFADIVNIGSNIDPDRTSGLVNFDSNANWTIEASGDVTLGPGLTLNSGASLTIKTKGKITINGCTIKSGATLNLEGQRLEIANNLNSEVNSFFNYHLIQD